ncbi:MAG TPA: hypothetical protein VK092_02525, partial [Deinococcales bacterium]|nr:hypothetical protein [Deinococcales bacterium]
QVRSSLMQTLQQHFRPEFLNRIDDIIVFHPLEQEQVMRIARIQLASLRERLADRRITLEVTDGALAQLAASGYDPVFGARPLKRAIQQQVENPLSKRIIEGDIEDGATVTLDAGSGGTPDISVRPRTAAPA